MPVNVRYPVIIALCAVCGGALGYAFAVNSIDIAAAVLCAVAVIAVTVFVCIGKASFKPAVFALIILVTVFSAFLCCLSSVKSFEKSDFDTDIVHAVAGNVSEKTDSYVVLDNVSVDGRKIGGKVILRGTDRAQIFFEEGYRLHFSAKLDKCDLAAYGKITYNAVENIRYSCYQYENLSAEYRFDLFARARYKVRQLLGENMGSDTAEICFAMLTGNTYGVDSGLLSGFRAGGIAHIFAVSGLHVGIVFALATFILKLFKVKKVPAAIISLVLIYAYAAMCGLSPSSLRAAVMCTVAAAVRIMHHKNDTLNSLAIAVTLLLFINPLNLFSVGFRLSVCSVGGITVFSKIPEKLLRKIKIPRKICAAVGAALGAQIGALPVMLASFGYVGAAGLLMNIIFVPLISILFSALFICVIVSALIPPAAAPLLNVISLPMDSVISFVSAAGFERAVFGGLGSVGFVVVFYVCALALTDKIRMRRAVRAIAAAVGLAVLCGFTLFAVFFPVNYTQIAVSAYYGGGEVLIKSSDGCTLIICDGVYSSHVLQTLNKYSAMRLKGIVILGGESAVNAYSGLGIDCRDVYLFSQTPVQPYGGATVHYERSFSVAGASFYFYDNESLSAEIGGVRIAVCCGERVPIADYALLATSRPPESFTGSREIFFSDGNFPKSVYAHGDYVYRIKDGKLT